VIRTSGDHLQNASLAEVGGKRLFVKEIEDALLQGDIDLAVHSSKDLPAALLDGLEIGAVLGREDPHDALVLPSNTSIAAENLDTLLVALGQTPTIGTASVRRIAQLKRLLPLARFSAIRGNLDTRLHKLDRGEHDALVLAAAGLRRLGFSDRITWTLPVSACVPAPGQGIIAVEVRREDSRLSSILRSISDAAAMCALEAERAVVETLGGGCHTPVGALATPLRNDALELVASVVALDGSRMVRTTVPGPRDKAHAIGVRAAQDLLAQGAGDILDAARRVDNQNQLGSP
jgi:hydroxymethylbilane synthase